MSEKQVQQYLEAMDAAAKKILSTPGGARRSLVEAGIVDENGGLTEHYRPPEHVQSSPAVVFSKNKKL